MKLNINKSYIVYTTSNYIENKKIRVLGYVNYDRASQYQSMIENVAINEKFIELTGDTVEYLKSQIYYDCAVIKNVNGNWVLTGEHIILWDDIIDSERTQKLNEDYTYKLNFKFKDFGTGDNITKEKIIKTIESALNSAYNSSKNDGVVIEKLEFSLEEVNDSSCDSVANQLEQARDVISEATTALNAFISLQDSAKSINAEFSDNDINTKINNMNETIDDIQSNLNTVLAKLS